MEQKTELEKWFEILDDNFNKNILIGIIKGKKKLISNGFIPTTVLMHPDTLSDYCISNKISFNIHGSYNNKILGLSVIFDSKMDKNSVLVK